MYSQQVGRNLHMYQNLISSGRLNKSKIKKPVIIASDFLRKNILFIWI